MKEGRFCKNGTVLNEIRVGDPFNQSMYYIKLSKSRGSSTTCVKGGSTEPSPASVTQGINIMSNRMHPSFERPGKGSPEKTRRELSIESTMSFRDPCPPQMPTTPSPSFSFPLFVVLPS